MRNETARRAGDSNPSATPSFPRPARTIFLARGSRRGPHFRGTPERTSVGGSAVGALSRARSLTARWEARRRLTTGSRFPSRESIPSDEIHSYWHLRAGGLRRGFAWRRRGLGVGCSGDWRSFAVSRLDRARLSRTRKSAGGLAFAFASFGTAAPRPRPVGFSSHRVLLRHAHAGSVT